MKWYKEKMKQTQKHYGNPQYELSDEEYAEIEKAQNNDEVMSEMAEDDKRNNNFNK